MASILIIDDDKSILGFLKEMLMCEGFSVLTALDGKEGMKLFNDNQVDLVITDMIMPKKEGTEIIIKMKKICPDIKIIAMSGGGFGLPEHYLDTAKYFRAQYTFEKPFNPSDLLVAVYELLNEEKLPNFQNSNKTIRHPQI